MFISEVLIVDDELERRDAFRRNLGKLNLSLTFADNVMAGIKCIRSQQFDHIFLDHDLGDERLNGTDIVNCMFGSVNCHTPVWVQSWNPSGSENMVAILNYLGIPTTKGEFQDNELFWSGVRLWLGVEDVDPQTCTGG